MAGIRVTTRRYTFQVVRELAEPYPAGAQLDGPRKAAEIARHLIGSEITEVLLAIFADARHRVTGYAEIARGTLNATRFTPRDVLVPALHANAAAVILAHNHPSGDPTPSRADRTVTAALRSAAELIGIALLDHVVVTESAHHSFRDEEGWA